MEVIHVREMNNNSVYDVYIGRKTGKFKGSPLANPYRCKVGDSREEGITREEAIDKYKEWLEKQIVIVGGPVHKELARLVELYKNNRNLRLACWCKPKACHGDVVKAIILRMAGEE